MALLSNGSSVKLSPPGGQNPQNQNDEDNDHFIFTNLFNAVPRDLRNGSSSVPQPHNDDLFGPNSLGAIGSGGNAMGHHLHSDILGAIGAGLNLTPSTSPQTSSSTGSTHIGIACGRCDINASNRCLDCNDVLCADCVEEHRRNNFTREHCLVGLNTTSPIGSSVNISNGSGLVDPQCDIHGEILRYVCESCKKVVCQECTLWEHKDHECVPVSKVSEGACDKIQSILDSGKLGTKYIKASIDRAVTFSQAVERDALEATSRIRKAFRHFIMATEDRERTLLERVDKYRQQKLTSLSDQMAGLRAALAGLSQTSDMLAKAFESVNTMSNMEIATILSRGEGQTEQFAAMYKNLQPKEEFITFVSPNFELLQEIRLQGDVVMMGQRLINSSAMSTSLPMSVTGTSPINALSAGNGSGGNILTRRPIIRSGSISVSRANSSWDQMNLNKNLLSTSPPTNISSIAPIPGMPNIGQAIPGSQFHVTAKPALGPSTSFAFDGHGDGQVSRPWGLCVDRDGNILVADRRNNRIQIFYPDGSFKHKFGAKGTGNGEFDLPAGISTDPQNRIIVVDKDNHRIQVFTTIGNFILKFGSYGKDCAQFQYPWDVASNSKGEILVTDSRNHRIQLFNPDGHFISRFSFDGVNHSRYLKGLTTPRGVCFTPNGDVIISDFENHRLLLIDSTLTKILATKGHEGSGIHEFCRPSGICCDDDGRVIVADSKNQRVVIFSPQLEYLWAVEIRPSTGVNLMNQTIDEKDRPSDIALLPDGRLVVMVETSPDARDQCSPQKTFVQIY